MSAERLKHPFGRENEMAVHCLFKSFCNNVHLGQWELAACSVMELSQQKDVLRKDIADILRQIVRTAYSKSLLSEAIPSYHHLAWLTVTELKKLNSWNMVTDYCLQLEAEFRLLLFDSCCNVDEDIVKEIYLTFLKVRCSSKILSSPAPLSSLTCEYLCSVLLREPVTGHNIISYLLGSEPSSTEHNRRLEDLELQCLQVLLTKLRKLSEQSSSTDDEEIDAKILKCRFCDLLALYDPKYGRNSTLEKFMSDLSMFLHSGCSDNVLDKCQVLSCLLGKSSTLLLEMFLQAEVQLQELQYIEGEGTDIQKAIKRGHPASDRTSYRVSLLVGLSRHRDRSEAWRDFFFYCYRSEKHFLDLIMETALHLIQMEDVARLNDLLAPDEFRPLKPVILLAGWDLCSDLHMADELLKILWSPEVDGGFEGINDACNRLSSQVKLTQWCLDKVRSLSGVDRHPAASLKLFFRGLDLHSALYLLHHGTSLMMLSHEEVVNFLRDSAAATEPSKDAPSESDTVLTKQVQFVLGDVNTDESSSVRHREAFNVDQEKDVNTYRAFTVLKSFMDVMAFSGGVCSPWDGEPLRSRQELHASHRTNTEPLVNGCAQATAASEIVDEVLRISEAFVREHSWLKLQRLNYSRLYKQNVLDVIAAARKHISELYPINYRLEILEDVFSLLFSTQEDLLRLMASDSWDSSEEGAIGDRSGERQAVDVTVTDLETTKDISDEDRNVNCLTGKLTTSDCDAVESHTRGHCSTASNHSTSSTSVKVGFLANQFVLRDVLLTVNELLQDLESLIEHFEGSKKELSPSADTRTVPSRHQHRRLAQVIPCSIEMEMTKLRYNQLMQYVSEALWRYQLISKDWLPKEYGQMPDESLDELNSYCFKRLFKHNDQGKCLTDSSTSRSEARELVTDSSTRTTMTDGSQSGASVSSSSGYKRKRKQKRRLRSQRSQMADVMGPVTRMMSDEKSLLNLSLKQGKFCQALQVVKMFNMDKTEIAKEVKFAELYSTTVKELRLDGGPSGHRFAKPSQKSKSARTGQHLPSKSTLTSIANVAAAGLSSATVANSVDRLLSLACPPGWQVESSKPRHQKSSLELLCEVYFEPACMATMICLDLACISSGNWRTSGSLIGMASKRLILGPKADLWSGSGIASSDVSSKDPHSLFRRTGQFGYEKLLHRLSSTMDLANAADDSHSAYYCRGIPVILTTVTLPLDSHDLEHYSDGTIAIQRELKHVSDVTREHGIWPYTSYHSNEVSDARPVLTAFKSLVSALQNAVPKAGWLEHLLHRSHCSPDRNYIQTLIEHVVTLVDTVSSLHKDKSQAMLQEPFHVLHFNPIKLLASLIFEANVDPSSLESACSSLHIDLIELLLQSTCPVIPVASQPQPDLQEIRQSSQDGHLILNDSGILRGDKCLFPAEKLVRVLLTHLIQVMKDIAKETSKEDMFSINMAQMLISSGKHKRVLHRTSILQLVDLNSLVTTEQKMCFYGNLITLMGIHMWLYAIERGEHEVLGRSVNSGHISDGSGQMIEVFLFQNKMAYKIGQLGVVSYIDLRYMITRQGLVPPSCFNGILQHRISTLDHCDPWVTYGCPGDPAMTFVIADGTPASPPLLVLNPDLVKFQLTIAMKSYITHCIRLEKNQISISPLLCWYSEDFRDSANVLKDDGNTIADLIKATLPEDCADDVLHSILDPGHEGIYRVKTFQYKTTWPLYVFSADTWLKLQEQNTPLKQRRSSLAISDAMSSAWPQEEPLIGSCSQHQELYVLGGEALKYVRGCNDLVCTVASVVSCDGSNSIKEHMLEDYFQPNTPTEEEKGFCVINRDLQEYRRVCLCDRYPVIARHVWINSGMWLVEYRIARSPYSYPPEDLDQVLKDLSLLDSSSRVCLLLAANSDHHQKHLQRMMVGFLERRQWELLFQLVCSFQRSELQHFHSSIRLLHDYCICCVLTVAIENDSDDDRGTSLPMAWPLLLKICDSELKCRMILGTLHHWDHDICLQLLKACLERDSGMSTKSALQQLVAKRLLEMQVYIKIISSAKEVLVKLRQTESFTLAWRFKQMPDNVDEDETEVEDKTSEILERLCQWQGVVEVSRQSPEVVLEVLTYTKDFDTAYKWADIYGVFDKFEQALRQVHITSLLDKTPLDKVTVYQVLNELRQHDLEKCFTMCSDLITKLSNLAHILCIAEYMIGQLRSDLGRMRLSELSTLSVGCKAVLCLPSHEQMYYSHLISSPLLILEQLLINNKLEWAKLVLTVYNEVVSQSDTDVYEFAIDDCDKLLERYAAKAVEFPVLENSAIGESDVLNRSTSKASLLSSTQSVDLRSSKQVTAFSPRSFQRTGSIGLLQTNVRSVPSTSHLTHSSTSVGSKQGNKMKPPFVMPAEPPSKDQWIPDSSALVCMVCQVERFSMFNRRHHCRRCGRVVCGTCSMKTTMIAGRSVRTCDQCYQQVFPAKNVGQQSDVQRLRQHLSGTSPESAGVSHHHGNLSVMIGSPSPSQETAMREEQSENQLPCSEIFYQLSLDNEINTSIREEFYYDHAPSTSLCLSLLDLHSNPQRSAEVLLSLCEVISQHLKPIAPGLRNPEVDYGLVISMMKRMLMSAKVRYIKAGDSSGVSQCGVYIDRVNLLDQLLSNNCLCIPSMCQLMKSDTLRSLRDSLIQEERFSLAIDVSTKCGMDPVGVWVAWGKACIRIGDYKSARDKFAKCLKTPLDMNQVQSQSSNKILSDIIDCLQTSRHNKCLAAVGSIKLLLTDPGQKPIEDLSLDDPVIQECLYYLHSYGTHVTIVTFYRQHKFLSKAVHYILNQKCNSDVFLEGLFLPCLSSGVIGQLLEQLQLVDPSMDRWLPYLTASCKHLSRTKQINTLYQLQIYMKDYLRAAMTCIQQFYLRGATSYVELSKRLSALYDAKKHMDTYLGERQWTSRPAQAEGMDTAPRLILTPAEVNKYIYTIETQLEVTRFLHQYSDNYDNVIAATERSASTTSQALPSSLSQTLSLSLSADLPTLFGNSRTKCHVASLVLLCGNNVHDGYGLAFRIIQHFKLDSSSVYLDVGQHFAELGRYKGIHQLLSCIRESGLCSDTVHDNVIMTCVKVIQKKPTEAKQLESLIKEFRNDSNKIEAFISCGKLKSAYLLAVKLGNLDHVKRIYEMSEQLGQQAVTAICRQYLQKHGEKK